jgi:hypothetical protein
MARARWAIVHYFPKKDPSPFPTMMIAMEKIRPKAKLMSLKGK